MQSDDFVKSIMDEVKNDLRLQVETWLVDTLFAGDDMKPVRAFLKCLMKQGVTMEQIINAAKDCQKEQEG